MAGALRIEMLCEDDRGRKVFVERTDQRRERRDASSRRTNHYEIFIGSFKFCQSQP